MRREPSPNSGDEPQSTHFDEIITAIEVGCWVHSESSFDRHQALRVLPCPHRLWEVAPFSNPTPYDGPLTTAHGGGCMSFFSQPTRWLVVLPTLGACWGKAYTPVEKAHFNDHELSVEPRQDLDTWHFPLAPVPSS